MNKFIQNAGIESFCTEGICYYTICTQDNCKVLYCKYHLLSSEEKCSENQTSEIFNLFLQNRIPSHNREFNLKPYSDNLEDFNIIKK